MIEIGKDLGRKLALLTVKIDMGSGSHNMREPLDEWIRVDGCADDNIDIVCDFGSVPLRDAVADELWSGDTVEHCPMWEWDKIFGEWNRLLKVGGIFKGSTPNLHSIMVRYAKGEMNLEDATNALYGWHNSKWQQHYVTFTTKTFEETFTRYGFGEFDFSQSPPVEANDPYNGWWIVWSCKKIKNL